MQRIIGIDFGTSTTYMNIKRYNGAQPDGDKFSYIPVMFNYGESSGYVATIVRENADGSFDFGEKASEPLEGSKIHTEIKMRLESSDEQERAEARRITREFFKFLHAQYAQQTTNLGGAGDQAETVVSYPVKWKKETAQFMLDAARDAGFQNVRGMDEAEAAVATVLCQNSGGTGLIYADKPGYLLLIDMGAGTTDLVVCRYQASANGEIAIELVTSWPHSADEPAFGGREIDKVLEQYVEDHLTKALLPALAPQASVIATAPGQAKMWKERNVSVTLAADKQVNTCAYIGTYKTMGMLTGDFPAFGRREFESFAESGLRDYARLISGCLEKTAEADENFSALDLVILTGGHSAWYFAKEILTGAMDGWLDHPMLAAVRENPCRVVSLPNPQTTVSLGLVYSKLPFKLAKHAEPKKTAPEPAPQNKASVPVEMPMQTDDIPIVVLPFDAKAMVTAMDIQAYLVMLEIGTDDTVTIDDRDLPLGQRIRTAEAEKDCYVLVVKDAKPSSWLLSVRRFGKDIGVMDIDQFEDMYRSEMSKPKAAKQTSQEPSFPKGQPVQLAAQYIWDDRFLSIVKQFIQEDPVIRSRNQIHKFPDHKKLWYLVERRNTTDHEIYCVIEFGNGGKSKAIICSHGLDVSYYQGGLTGYSHGPEGGVVSWEEFLNGNLRDLNSFAGKLVQEKFGLGDSLCRLQALLREEASKGKSKQSTTQTFQTVENESFDAAMKRFNGQVKDAKRQQKAPAQPTRTVTQTSNRTYKWDARLLQFVKKFIEEDPALRNTNVHNHRGDIVAQMRKNFGLSHWDIIYYAMPSGMFSRKKYQSGVIISSTGLWYREGLFKISTEEHFKWEMVLNGVVHAATKECPIETIEYRNLRFTCPRWAFGETGAMSRLQTLLREKSIALEEGCPI